MQLSKIRRKLKATRQNHGATQPITSPVQSRGLSPAGWLQQPPSWAAVCLYLALAWFPLTFASTFVALVAMNPISKTLMGFWEVPPRRGKQVGNSTTSPCRLKPHDPGRGGAEMATSWKNPTPWLAEKCLCFINAMGSLRKSLILKFGHKCSYKS